MNRNTTFGGVTGVPTVCPSRWTRAVSERSPGSTETAAGQHFYRPTAGGSPSVSCFASRGSWVRVPSSPPVPSPLTRTFVIWTPPTGRGAHVSEARCIKDVSELGGTRWHGRRLDSHLYAGSASAGSCVSMASRPRPEGLGRANWAHTRADERRSGPRRRQRLPVSVPSLAAPWAGSYVVGSLRRPTCRSRHARSTSGLRVTSSAVSVRSVWITSTVMTSPSGSNSWELTANSRGAASRSSALSCELRSLRPPRRVYSGATPRLEFRCLARSERKLQSGKLKRGTNSRSRGFSR